MSSPSELLNIYNNAMLRQNVIPEKIAVIRLDSFDKFPVVIEFCSLFMYSSVRKLYSLLFLRLREIKTDVTSCNLKRLPCFLARGWGRPPRADDDDDGSDTNRCYRWNGRSSNVTSSLNFPPSAQCPVHWMDTVQSISSHLPCFLRTFRPDTMEAGNHMSDNFMVDDFNIRHSSQRGYTLESFNSQWSRGPLNQYGVL